MGAGLNELRDVYFRPGAKMRNDFACRQSAEPSAARKIKIMSETIEKAGGIEIASTRGIHHPRYRSSVDEMYLAAPRHH